MSEDSDEILALNGSEIRRLPARPFRAGLFGETLEAALQALIARHPEVLPGAQMEPGTDDPPRFALLRREMPVGGWSLDHLLVDQRGVLTLVETKLAENPEARRAVVGQIMEYAANAREFWGDGRARELADQYWNRDRGKSVDDEIRQRLGIEPDKLWALVDQKLRDGRIRLVIVADELTSEVRRIIEYLNEEMETAEIFGLEIKCYGNDDKSLVLVPRLLGQTQAALDRKGVQAGAPVWLPGQLRESYQQVEDQEAAARLQELLTWAVDRGVFLPARAKKAVFGIKGKTGQRLFTVYPDGTVYWYMNERNYPGGRVERDSSLAELRQLSLVSPELDPGTVSSGRNLSRKLAELNSEEFSSLVRILGQACGC